MNKRIILWIFVLIFIIQSVSAVVPPGCTFVGNHYECTITAQTSSITFDAGGVGIEINEIDVTSTEAMDWQFSSDTMILVHGDVSIVTSVGRVEFNLEAPIIKINSSISLTTDNGDTTLSINGTTSTLINTSTITIKSGKYSNTAFLTLDGDSTIINRSNIVLIGQAAFFENPPPTTHRGGAITLNYYGTVIEDDVAYDIDTGRGGGGGWGNGGNGGALIFNHNSLNYTSIKNISIDMDTGDGMAGGGTSARGGDSDIMLSHILGSRFDFVSFDIQGGDGTPRLGAGPGRGGKVIVNLTNIFSTNLGIISRNGDNGDCAGGTTAGSNNVLYLMGTNNFTTSNISLKVGTYCSGQPDEIIFDYGNIHTNNFILNTSLALSGASNDFYYMSNATLSSFRNSTFDMDGSPTEVHFNATEINFYDNVLIDLETTTAIFRIYADRALFWNFTVNESSTIDSDFYNRSVANATIGLRGNNTFGTGWTWNTLASQVNQTFDHYFFRGTIIELIKKSNDVSSFLYNFTNFTCRFKAEYSNENQTAIKSNISLVKDGVAIYYQNGTDFTSNVLTNSTIVVNGTDTTLGEDWACAIEYYGDFIVTNTTTNKTILTAHPFNITIRVGDTIAITITGRFNKSEIIDIGTNAINDYIQNTCDTPTCTIPLNFVNLINSALNVSDLNVTYGRDSTIENENETNVAFRVFSTTSGVVNITDIVFTYFTKNANITVTARNSVDNVTRNIEVTFSNYSVEIIPQSIDTWNIGPNIVSPTDKNVQPYGNYNGKGNPFWGITSYAPKLMDVYVMYNSSPETTCINVTFNMDIENICLQETANETVSCGGLNSGVYADTNDPWVDVTLTYDGDYDTCSNESAKFFPGVVEVNYTNPSNLISSPLWQMKGESGTVNKTLNQSCYDAYNDKIVLRYISTSIAIWECYNTTDWVEVYRDATSNLVCEESIYWNITNLNGDGIIVINGSSQLIFNDLPDSGSVVGNVSTLANLSCSWDDPFTIEYFRFIGICSECVRTYDWEDMNSVIQ